MVLENNKKIVKPRKKDKISFQEQLNELLSSGKLPANYATIIKYLRPDISKTRIYNVKRVGTIDWDVFELMKSLADTNK